MNKTLIIIAGLVLIIIVLVLYFSQKPEALAPIDSEQKESVDLNMKIISSAFENNKEIPSKYTCDSEDISPPLEIQEVPQEAKSLALIVDDPDAPAGTWTHWLLWNIDPQVSLIEENSIPQGAVQGINSFGKKDYGGPCPPSGSHRYVFKLYALDNILDIEEGSQKGDLERIITGHVLAEAQLIGNYKR